MVLPVAGLEAANVAGPQIRLADDLSALQIDPRVEGSLAASVEVDPNSDEHQVFVQALDPVGHPAGPPGTLTVAGPDTYLVDLVPTGDPLTTLAVIVELTGDEIQGRLYYRILRPGGAQLGTVVEIAEIPIRTYALPVVAADALRNELVVAWSVPEDYFPDGRPFAFSDVVAQRFRLTTGAPLGAEIPVNGTNVVNDQLATGITLDADGSFVVLWDGYTGESGFGDVFARRFGADDAPLTSDVPVTEHPDFRSVNQESSRMARDADGNHLVVWDGVGQDEQGDPSAFPETAILARWMGPDLEPLGDEFLVNATEVGDQARPNVAVAADGAAMVTWTGPVPGTPEVGPSRRAEQGVFYRPVDLTGPSGPEVRVDRPGSSDRDLLEMDVWLGDGGDLAVVWSQVQPRDGIGSIPPVAPARAWSRRFPAAGEVPPVPDRPGTAPPALPGYRVWVDVSQRTTPNDTTPGALEPDCIPETACFSGNLPGRSELFVRLIGPRPNGYFWVVLTRFTPSRVEVWVEQEATGQVNYYVLEPQGPDEVELPGLSDRTAFLPVG